MNNNIDPVRCSHHKRKTEEWIKNLEQELDGKNPDYLVISHLEPDHSGSLEVLLEKYPNIKLVGNEKTFSMLPQFVDFNIEEKTVKVSEGDILEIGKHKLQFFMAPMVHWPEVMVTYEQKEKILFSADGFGTFGTTENREDWESEARRYYFNIVGKYGMQVQMLLKKLSTIEVKMICSLHGPILKENLEFYINKYNLWSSYTPENEGVLNIAWHLYEFIVLAIPIMHTHPDGECNEAMMDKYNQYVVRHIDEDQDDCETDDVTNESDRTDPRWDALKNISNNN